jgi:hypothetical protein
VAVLLAALDEQPEPQEALATCTEAMLAAAAAVLEAEEPSLAVQLSQSCITAGMLAPLAGAMRRSTKALETADAAVAAALAAGNGPPVQFKQQQRAPAAARLAIAQLQVFERLYCFWPGSLLSFTQGRQLVLPGAQLLVAAIRLALRLLAAGNKELCGKLLKVTIKIGSLVAMLWRCPEQGPSPPPAQQQLLQVAALPELQLLLLVLAVKTHSHRCLQQQYGSNASRSRRQRQQQQQLSLDPVQHKHLLALLQECGLSNQQAAAEPWPAAAVQPHMDLCTVNVLASIRKQFNSCSQHVARVVVLLRQERSERQLQAWQQPQQCYSQQVPGDQGVCQAQQPGGADSCSASAAWWKRSRNMTAYCPLLSQQHVPYLKPHTASSHWMWV